MRSVNDSIVKQPKQENRASMMYVSWTAMPMQSLSSMFDNKEMWVLATGRQDDE